MAIFDDEMRSSIIVSVMLCFGHLFIYVCVGGWISPCPARVNFNEGKMITETGTLLAALRLPFTVN